MILPRTNGGHDASRDEVEEHPFEQGDPARYTAGMSVPRISYMRILVEKTLLERKRAARKRGAP